MDGVNAERASRDYICLHVIDIDRTARIDRKALDQQLEVEGNGIDEPDFTRDQNAVKPAPKFEPLEGRRIGFGREIGQAVEGRAPIAQLGQELDRTGNRAGHHLVETAEIRIDQLGLFRMLGFQQPGALGKTAAGILAAVPFMRADIREEMLARGLVAREQLAIEMPGIPSDQSAPQVEHDGIASRFYHSPVQSLSLFEYDRQPRLAAAMQQTADLQRRT